jgi:hypothetical protein
VRKPDELRQRRIKNSKRMGKVYPLVNCH